MRKPIQSIAVVLFIILCLPLTAFAEDGNWGLGFSCEGKKPNGNASADELLDYDAYFVGKGEDKVVYLTFDAGFENGYTGQILDVLKEKSVPASFFLVGTYIRDNPELITRMLDEGHIIGNHTMSHPDMSAISSKESFLKELSQTEAFYKQATGQEMPKYYRPPQGKYSVSNLAMAKELGYKTIFWSLAYVDWNVNDQPSKEQAFSKLIPRVHPGTVLLLHSTSETNAKILGDLIDEYRSMGYEFRSIDELVQ